MGREFLPHLQKRVLGVMNWSSWKHSYPVLISLIRVTQTRNLCVP